MATVISGLVGGLIATIAMTVVMMAIGDDSPPPPAQVWSQYIGDGEPQEYMMQGMVLHLIYGIIAGGVFVVLVPAIGFSLGTLTMAIVWGIVWAVVLFIVGAVFWMRIVLGVEPAMQMVMMFGLFHLVYGVVLGAWVGLGII